MGKEETVVGRREGQREPVGAQSSDPGGDDGDNV